MISRRRPTRWASTTTSSASRGCRWATPRSREGGVLALAGELVTPLSIDLAFDHIQLATSIYGWDHEPGGGDIDGYGLPGQTEPATFTLLAGIYLGDETQGGRGNLWVWPGAHRIHERARRAGDPHRFPNDETQSPKRNAGPRRWRQGSV